MTRYYPDSCLSYSCGKTWSPTAYRPTRHRCAGCGEYDAPNAHELCRECVDLKPDCYDGLEYPEHTE